MAYNQSSSYNQSDFQVTAGNTKVVKVVLKDTDKSPIDLNGASIVWRVAKQYGSPPLVTKVSSNTSQIEITNANSGLFEIVLMPNDTLTMGGQQYVHEAVVTLSDNTVTSVLAGELFVEKTVFTGA